MKLFSYEYLFIDASGRRGLPSPCRKAYKTLRGAEKAAAKCEAEYAELSCQVETRVFELVDDGRCGRRAAA